MFLKINNFALRFIPIIIFCRQEEDNNILKGKFCKKNNEFSIKTEIFID